MSEAPDLTKVFDAAKAIVETLGGLNRTHQELAMRFAGESLGLSADTRPSAPPAPAAPSQTPTASATDIRQFTTSKDPKSDQQFAAVAAYFYRFEAPEAERKETIGAKDLENAARLAKRRQPRNALFTLNNAKNAGYLDSAGRGQFRINTVGENLVTVTLPSSQSEGIAKRARKKTARGGKKLRPAKRRSGK